MDLWSYLPLTCCLWELCAVYRCWVDFVGCNFSIVVIIFMLCISKLPHLITQWLGSWNQGWLLKKVCQFPELVLDTVLGKEKKEGWGYHHIYQEEWGRNKWPFSKVSKACFHLQVLTHNSQVLLLPCFTIPDWEKPCKPTLSVCDAGISKGLLKRYPLLRGPAKPPPLGAVKFFNTLGGS